MNNEENGLQQFQMEICQPIKIVQEKRKENLLWTWRR